jgi:DNA end-binding protein Ku
MGPLIRVNPEPSSLFPVKSQRRIAMAPRANWKGFLKVGEFSCPIALYTAASTSDRIAFHTINSKTGHRVHRKFIDGETGKAVERDDQVKGYDTGGEDYVIIEPEEVEAIIPDSDKTITVSDFISCSTVDDVFFDKPYYLAPSQKLGAGAYALIYEGMHKRKVAAIGKAVLFRRVRTLLIRAHVGGLIAHTLEYDYEVRSSKKAFEDIRSVKIEGEMLDLAMHIIKTKHGKFEPKEFEDRYDDALSELVKTKLNGKPINAPAKPEPTKTDDLLQALRQSAGVKDGPSKSASTKKLAKSKSPAAKRAAEPKRKVG